MAKARSITVFPAPVFPPTEVMVHLELSLEEAMVIRDIAGSVGMTLRQAQPGTRISRADLIRDISRVLQDAGVPRKHLNVGAFSNDNKSDITGSIYFREDA